MKTTIKFTVGAVMAVMIVPFFLVNGAQAYSRQITYNNGATWTVNHNGGGNTTKAFVGANGETYNYGRSCSNGSCTHTRTSN